MAETTHIENETGYVIVEGCSPVERVQREDGARQLARVRCHSLADALAATDPQRAQRLRDVANDPQATPERLWGTYKNDDRQVREAGQTETRVR